MATRKPGGPSDPGAEIFKDPGGKWNDGDDEATVTAEFKKNLTAQKAHESAILSRLVSDPQNAAAALLRLAEKLGRPGISIAERTSIRRSMTEARAALQKTQETAREFQRTIRADRTQQQDAQRKLMTVRAYEKASQAWLAEEDRRKLATIEKSLMTIIRTSPQLKDRRSAEAWMKQQEKIQELLEELPEQIQQEFADRDKQTEMIIASQKEAKEFIQEQNRKMREFAGTAVMKTLDFIGVGGYSLGSVVRGAQSVGRGYQNVKDKVQSIRDGAGTVAKYIQSKRILSEAKRDQYSAEAVDIERDRLQNEMELTDSVRDHVGETRRFNARALDAMRKPKSTVSGGMGFGTIAGAIMSGIGAITGAIAAVKEFLGSLVGRMLSSLPGLPGTPRLPGPGPSRGPAKTPPPAGAGSAAGRVVKFLAKAGTAVSLATYSGDLNKDEGAELERRRGKGATIDDAARSFIRGGGSGMRESMDPRRLDAGPIQADSASAIPISAPTPSTAGDVPITGGANSRRVSSWMGKLFTAGSRVDTDGLNPQMQSSLIEMGKEYYAATGKKLQLNSGFRSNEEQASLFRSKPPGMAAAPGSSLHNYGLAVDMQSAQANELDKMGLLEKYGFGRPIAKEKWHVQPKGVALAAARAGVYSADGPANQGSGMGSGVARSSQSTPTVTDASIAFNGPDFNANSGGYGGTSSRGGAASSSSRVSVKSIPTFDASDGMFLALNFGVV